MLVLLQHRVKETTDTAKARSGSSGSSLAHLVDCMSLAMSQLSALLTEWLVVINMAMLAMQ